MRDIEGNRPTPLWPYFKREQDVATLRKGDPIPVNSCWNGVTVFDAKWFLPTSPEDRNATATPGVDDGPIRFRTHPECNVSECLLPSYDIHVRSKQRPLIFVNPKAVASKCSGQLCFSHDFAFSRADMTRVLTLLSLIAAYQYNDYIMYDWIMRSNIVNLWSRVWQDVISHLLFGFFAELGRKKDECADALRSGWKTI